MATKVSEITTEEVAAYLRLDDASSSDSNLLATLLTVAKAFITSQTGLDADGQDEHDDLMIVVMILVQDMYDNRTLYVESTNVNQTVASILGSHRQNFVPSGDEDGETA